jgi:hypothetical protein
MKPIHARFAKSLSPRSVVKGYGTVTPRNKPEDFHAIREEFETGVARDVSEETEDKS